MTMPSFPEQPESRFPSVLVALSLALSVFAAGCTMTNKPVKQSPDLVAKASPFGEEWDKSVGNMGLAAIVPPSEDVRVGDMYVYAFNPDFLLARGGGRHPGGLALSPRWASLNLLKELQQEYQLRPDLPKTPDTYFNISDDPVNRDWAEPRNPGKRSIFAEDGETDRLRIMGIPEFSSVTLTEGELNAIVPTEAVNLVFGLAWSDDKAITIRLNATESYSLGLQKLSAAALESNSLGYALKAPFRDNLDLVSAPLSDTVWVRVLSEVIYVRSIDIIIQSQAAFKLDEDVNASEFVGDLEEAVEMMDEEAPVAAEEDTQIRDDKALPDHVLDSAYTAFVRAEAINEILIESDSDDLPGGFLRFVSVTDDSVTVRRIWQRGLAVGARGLTLEVDKATGQLVRSSNMGKMPLPPSLSTTPVE